jgi:glutamate N-acetyltransferase/amino-acid N-acetyltransferase
MNPLGRCGVVALRGESLEEMGAMNEEVPAGFRFAGVHSGVKRDPAKKDMTVVLSDHKASAAGVFTTNRVCAAPVHLTRSRVPAPGVRGVVINSGNANACTGEQGRRDAEAMTLRLAKHLHCDPSHVLVCSTGVIGRPMPMDAIERGVDHAFAAAEESWAGVEAAASGILTTDSVPKIVARSVEVGGKKVRILGICKGAAMIGPNMATMLGLILTDGAVSPEFLDRILRKAVDRSFHCISVEGHTSTNDTVLLLANGASGVTIPQSNGSASNWRGKSPRTPKAPAT